VSDVCWRCDSVGIRVDDDERARAPLVEVDYAGVRGHERHVVKVLSESWLVFVLSEAVRHHERCDDKSAARLP
jgi:5'(3')-deoxyribonucleotidase